MSYIYINKYSNDNKGTYQAQFVIYNFRVK